MDNLVRVKTIEQNTFDEAVRENIKDFEMDLSEAIKDAVEQFKSQKIELSNIVKTLSLNENDEPFHPVVGAINKLKTVVNADTVDAMIQYHDEVDRVKAECDKGIQYRILAAKNDGYPIMMSMCQNLKNNSEIFIRSFSALLSLSKGQPDLLRQEDLPFISEALRLHKESIVIVILLLTFIKVVCTQHENNRQNVFKSDIIPQIFDHFKFTESPAVIIECCAVFKSFTLDDDIRVPFGKAHDHAKSMVCEFDALKILSERIAKFEENPDVLRKLLSTLSKLAVRNEFCQEIVQQNGLKYALQALLNHAGNQGLVMNALVLVKTIAGNDDVRKEIIDCGGASSIINALQRHVGKSPVVVEAGCTAIAMLSMRNTQNCEVLVQSGVIYILIQAMKLHPDHKGVQRQGCLAMRNIVSRSKHFIPNFIEQGAEELINQARVTHQIHDETKAALRDLGCKIELQELWKGEHGDVCK